MDFERRRGERGGRSVQRIRGRGLGSDPSFNLSGHLAAESKSLEKGSVLQSLGELLSNFGSDHLFESGTTPFVAVRDDSLAVIFSHGVSF